MAVSIAKQGYELGHGHHDEAHEEVIYQETRDMRLLGFVLFLCSDVVLFSSLIFAYIYLRTTVAPTWPPIMDGHQLPRLDTAFAAVNSVVLFGSGVTMHYAMEGWKHGNKGRFNLFMLLTIILGTGFLGGQAYEYTHVPDRCFGPVYDGHCFVTGENVLENMSLDHENKWVNVGIMAAFAVAYRLMCFAVLHYKLVKRHR